MRSHFNRTWILNQGPQGETSRSGSSPNGCVRLKPGPFRCPEVPSRRPAKAIAQLQAHDFSEGIAAVQPDDQKGLWGYIDHSGMFVIGPRFSDAGSFEGGLAPAAIHSAYGYIDRQGNIVVQPKFENAYSFTEGLVCVIDSRGKYGSIDRTWHP